MTLVSWQSDPTQTPAHKPQCWGCALPTSADGIAGISQELSCHKAMQPPLSPLLSVQPGIQETFIKAHKKD